MWQVLKKNWPIIVIWLLVFIFGSVYSTYSIVRHLKMETFAFDLGIYDQIIWLFGHGRPLFSSLLEVHPWADHFTPTLLLLSPLYWLWDNVIILLVFQAFFSCLGAIPIYLLAKKKLNNEIVSIVIAFGYLAFWGIQNAIAFDFHPIMLATTLLAYIFWFYENKKFKLFWLTILLILGLQENFFLLMAAYGIFLVFRFRDWKRGGALFLGGLGIFGILVTVIMPGFGQTFTYAPIHLKKIGEMGVIGGIGEIINLMINPSSKLEVMYYSLASFGFLPLLSPVSWILLLEEFGQRFVGTLIPTRWEMGFQYNCILAPILAWGTMEGIERVQKLKGTRGIIERNGIIILGIIAVFAGTVMVQIKTIPAMNDLLDKKFYDYSRTNDAREVLAQIPPDSSVAAINNYIPQLTHREHIILLTNCIERPGDWRVDVKRCFKLQPEYMIDDINLEHSNWNDYYPDYDRWVVKRLFDYLVVQKKYKIVYQKGTVVLIQKIN